jgi:tetratricopeptide (TPR) repeat protein
MQAALQSYEQALLLFRQVGDRLGEANCYLAQGRVALEQKDYQKALTLHTDAYRLYQHIQDAYSQARLLYYRSLVYEAMNEKTFAVVDIETALSIAQALNLPFVDLLQKRLEELKSAGNRRAEEI